MGEPLGSLVAAVGALIDGFERSGIPYALGGAIAYSAWAEPRATQDVDVNVWVDLDGLAPVFDLLEAVGVTLDRAAALRTAHERGLFIGRHGAYRVDVFVPSVAFYEPALARRVRVRLAGRDTWVLSAEVLAVFKLLFFRPKDIADVGRLLQVQGTRLDRAFVRHWLVVMLGRGDDRVRTWDRLVAVGS